MGDFSFAFDHGRRLLRVVSEGVWTEADVDRYIPAFREHFVMLRARYGCARVLVDGRTAITAGERIGPRLADLARLFDRPDDCIAIVTPTSLRKQQVGRDGLPERGKAFVSLEAAETWLLAHDQAGDVPIAAARTPRSGGHPAPL